jgi:DNA-binding NtrC family response regulator
MDDGKRVMVLDDEPIVGERLKAALEKEGFAVEVFTDSATAIERLKEQPFPVLVTDMKMRGPSGMDVLQMLEETKAPTRVIVITGYATIEMNHEARAHGAYEFIAKPFKTGDLVKLVAKAARAS